MPRVVLVLLALVFPWAVAQEEITLALQPYERIQPADSASISGTLLPADAVLWLNGGPVSLDDAGNFSLTVPLLEGVNDLLFRATHATLPTRTFKHSFVFDQTPPTLLIDQPTLPFYTNRNTVTVLGRVGDNLTDPLVLTRDGVAIPIQGFQFFDQEVPLVEGGNTFTYEVSDASGNQSHIELQVFRREQAADIALTIPTRAPAFGGYQLAVHPDEPDDVVFQELRVGDDVVFSSRDGRAFSQSFTHSGDGTRIPVHYRARDRYGNEVEQHAAVTIDFPLYVYGLILDDATSYPLPGIEVTLSSPTASQTVTTDAAGGFEAYLQGSPVTVSVTDPAYVSLQRRYTLNRAGGLRVHDLRLCRRGSAQSLALPINWDGLALTLSGYSGSVQACEIGPQALPNLLPLGWSPVRTFALLGQQGQGRVRGQITLPTAFPDTANLVLLQQQDAAWQVAQIPNRSGDTLSLDVDGVGAATWVLVVGDAGLPRPNLGDLLQRDSRYPWPATSFRNIHTDPEVLSPSQEAATTVFLKANGAFPSGSHAVISADEHNLTYDGSDDPAAYPLDVLLYRSHGEPTALGELRFKMRSPIAAGTTRSATTKLIPMGGTRTAEHFTYADRVTLERLQLDFGPQPGYGEGAGPRAVQVQSDQSVSLPLSANATQLAMFRVDLNRSLERAPTLRYDHGDNGALLLLRHDQNRWTYAGTFRYRDGAWHNDPTATDLTTAAVYAVVHVPQALTEIRGSVQFEGVPQADVWIGTAAHPWYARSGDNGRYAAVVWQTTLTQELNAEDPATGRTAAGLLPATGTNHVVDPFDLTLSPPDFHLVSITPETEPLIVPTWQTFRLTFNRPLPVDREHWQQRVSISDGTQTFPLRLVYQPQTFQLQVRGTNLPRGADLTLTVDRGLHSADGVTLDRSYQWTYSTETPTTATPLDLDRFYLDGRDGEMALVAPEGSYPHRTKIMVLNQNTASSRNDTLLDGGQRLALSGEPGHVYALTATTPDGRVVQRLFDAVQTGPNQYRLGLSETRIDLPSGAVLRLHAENGGLGREVRLAPLSLADARAQRDAIPTLAALDSDPYDAFSLEIADGGLPFTLQAGYQHTLDSEPPPGNIGLLRLLTDTAAPADPFQPETTARFNVAEVLWQATVEADSTTKRKKTSLFEVNADFFSLALNPTNSFVIDSRFKTLTLHSLREQASGYQGDSRGLFLVPGRAPWFATHDPTPWVHYEKPQPIYGVPIYDQVRSGAGVYYTYRGITDQTGQLTMPYADTFTLGSFLTGLDPLTNAVTTAKAVAGTHRDVVFKWREDSADPNQALLKLTWQVIERDADDPNAAIFVLEDESENLARHGYFNRPPPPQNAADPTMIRGLRLKVTSDKNLKRLTLQVGDLDPVVVDETHPNGRNPTAFTLDWLGTPANGRLLQTQITVTLEPDPEPAEQRFERTILVRGGGDQVVNDPQNPPMVLRSEPYPDQQDVLPTDPLRITFSESVRGVDAQTIQLREGNVSLPLLLRDGNLEAVTPDRWVTELILLPQNDLRFNSNYELVLGSLLDQNNNGLVHFEGNQRVDGFRAAFTTRAVPNQDLNQGGLTHRAVAGLQNLTFHLVPTKEAESSGLTLFVDDTTYAKPARISEYSFPAANALFPAIAVFTPQELAARAGTELHALGHRVGQRRYDRVPTGTVVAVKFWAGLKRSSLRFLEYREGAFQPIFAYDVPQATVRGGMSSIGPYLLLGALEPSGSGPAGSTDVIDMRDLLKLLKTLREQAFLQGHSAYITAWQQVKRTTYPNPRGVLELNGFQRTGAAGLRLAFTAAGLGFPGVTNLSQRGRVPVSPVADFYDPEAVIATRWGDPQAGVVGPGRYGVGNLDTGVVEHFSYLRGNTPATRDLAVFSERHGDGSQVRVYELPYEVNLREPTEPTLLLTTDTPVTDMAVDRDFGLLALSFNVDRKPVIKVWSLRTLFQAVADQLADPDADLPITLNLSDNQNQRFVFWEADGESVGDFQPYGETLVLYHGRLFFSGRSEDQQHLSQAILIPVDYRRTGWLTYDLAAWQKDTTSLQDARIDADALTVLPHAVLYATDLPDRHENSEKSGFYMETGSWGIDLDRDEQLKLTITPQSDIGLNAKTYTSGVRTTPGLVSFNTRAITDHFVQTEGAAKVLRTNGYVPFEITYQILMENVVIHEDKTSFLVVYRDGPTRYRDGARFNSGLDLQRGTLETLIQDHSLPARDARMDLSPGRALSWDYAFSVGDYGTGMLDAQRVYAAMPIWWKKTPTSPEDFDKEKTQPIVQVIAEQPGLWQLIGEPAPDGRSVAFYDDPVATLNYSDSSSRWELNHGGDVVYQLTAVQQLPNILTLLGDLNRDTDITAERDFGGDRHDRFRYPLVREPGSADTPGALFTLLKEKNRSDKPWGNTVNSSGKQPQRHPYQLVDQANDGGGERSVQRSYTTTPAGTVIEEQRENGFTITYSYDDHAYLTAVSLMPQGNDRSTIRKTEYSWEAVKPNGVDAVALGDFTLKRLTEIKQVQGDAKEVLLTLNYAATGDLHVASINSGLCDKSLTINRDQSSGLPTGATLTGCSTFTESVSFADVHGMRLAGQVSPGPGFAFDLTWEREPLTHFTDSEAHISRRIWYQTGNTFQGQSVTYDAHGRPIETTRNRQTTQFTYMTDAARRFQPATVKTGDVTMTYTWDGNKRTTTDSVSGQSVTTLYSSSGVPVGGENPVGLTAGGDSSNQYLPNNGQVRVDRAGAGTRLNPDDDQPLGRQTFNRFGEVVGFEQLGVSGSVRRDLLGRVVQATQGDKELVVAYSNETEGGVYRRKIAYEDHTVKQNWSEHYDERGLLREIRTTEPTTSLTRLSYDPLGRLTTEVVSEGNRRAQTGYTYFGNTHRIETVTGPNGITARQNWQQQENGIALTGASRGLAGQTDRINVTRSPDGISGETEINGVGNASVARDGLGRVQSVTHAGDRVETHYENLEITQNNGFSNQETRLSFENPSGTHTRTEIADGTTGDRRTVEQQVRVEGDHLVFSRKIGNDHEGKIVVNGEGEILTIEAGNRQLTFSDYHPNGAPGHVRLTSENAPGETTATTLYDDHGRPRSGTDPHGNPWSVTYNDRNLIATSTNDRGLTLSYEWHPELDIVDRITTNAPSRAADDGLVLFQRASGQAGMLESSSGNWLGHQQTQTRSIQEDRKEVTVTETISRPGASAKRSVSHTVRMNENNKLVDSATGPDGTTRFDHTDYGRDSTTRLPNGKTFRSEQDGFGQTQRRQNDGLTTLKVDRDDRGRPTQMRTQDRVVRVAYDEDADAISRIDGLSEPIVYQNFNHLGQAQRVDVGNGRLVFDLEYHAGGRLRCLTQTPKGGLPSSKTYNSLGDLTQLQRANQAPVSYTYNVWGAVDSLTFQGRDYRVFGDGGQGKLNFPGDVGADVDSKGRLVEIKRPGLALKEFTYTDSDQVDQILFDGELLRDHDYVNGDLSEIRAVHPSGVEDLYGYGYDEHGRLTTVTENGNIIAAWTYPSLDNISQDPERQWGDSERVLTTTDGNGVVYSYDYDRFGNISVIELSDGPSFYYRFDENSNPLEIRSSGMSVTYQNWQQGLPSTMSWGDGTEFSISRDSNDNLTRIADNAEVFVLDLSWRQNSGSNAACEEGGGPAAKRITQVTRTAGDFTEVIEPDYNEDEHLTGVRINRNSNGNQNIIEEGYGAVQNQLLAGLTRVLNGTVLVDNVFQHEAEADNRRIHQSSGQPGASQASGTDQYSYDPRLGNLNQITYRDGKTRTFVWDGFRRLREIRDDGNLVAQYHYDTQYRRIRAATQHNPLPLAFAYQGSKVIAIGLYEGPGQVQWTHAIGQGPLGPAFIKDLTGASMDYYIFNDHLGTPLAYKNANTGALYLTPHSAWGTLLANTPTRGSPYPNQNFELPPDPVFATVPLGLSGHLHDTDTGLTYMHHRFYSPELGHFLNPDFRAPDIYDPSTFTEPYAFASGNPIMFWDPNGLQSSEDLLNRAVGQHLFQLGLIWGMAKETALSSKDLFLLYVQWKAATSRIRESRARVFWDLDPLEGIEQDEAFISAVKAGVSELILEKGIFQQIGAEGGNSLAVSWMLAEQGRSFEAGKASVKFAEAISLMISLPKAGLAVTGHSSQKILRQMDDFSKITQKHGRKTEALLDLRDSGDVFNDKKRLYRAINFLEERQGIKIDIEFTDRTGIAQIDEIQGKILLNPETANFDHLAHEISHVRFSHKIGKWRTGKELTNFEINVMEAIAYHNMYRKGRALGFKKDRLLKEYYMGPWFASVANFEIFFRPQRLNTYLKLQKIYGKKFLDDSLRFDGKGLKRGKTLP